MKTPEEWLAALSAIRGGFSRADEKLIKELFARCRGEARRSRNAQRPWTRSGNFSGSKS